MGGAPDRLDVSGSGNVRAALRCERRHALCVAPCGYALHAPCFSFFRACTVARRRYGYRWIVARSRGQSRASRYGSTARRPRYANRHSRWPERRHIAECAARAPTDGTRAAHGRAARHDTSGAAAHRGCALHRTARRIGSPCGISAAPDIRTMTTQDTRASISKRASSSWLSTSLRNGSISRTDAASV